MEITNLILATLVILAVTVPVINSEKRGTDEEGSSKPPPGFNPLEDLILNQDRNGFKPGSGASLSRVKRQYIDSDSYTIESGDDVAETSEYEGQYPYPYPVPIIIGGGFGAGFGRGSGVRGYGGRGYGGRGFGGRGFGGRGFGGRGIGGRGGAGRGGGGGRG